MKTCAEWSIAFDLEYQNITSNQAPGLNKFEKSQFLTWAQESVLVALYNGSLGKSFEETEEVTAYMNSLVKQATCIAVNPQNSVPHIVEGSTVYTLPEKLLFRTYEKCVIDTGSCGDRDAVVVPVTQDEFWRTNRNPFKRPNKNRVLRLSMGDISFSTTLSEKNYSELVSAYAIDSYTVRYVERPDPIILEDLSASGLSIDEQTLAMPCKLHERLHHTILSEAVRMAKEVWSHPNN